MRAELCQGMAIAFRDGEDQPWGIINGKPLVYFDGGNDGAHTMIPVHIRSTNRNLWVDARNVTNVRT